MAHGSSWARNQTRTTAVTQATALTMPESYPDEPQENSCHYNFKEKKLVVWHMTINKTDDVKAPWPLIYQVNLDIVTLEFFSLCCSFFCF